MIVHGTFCMTNNLFLRGAPAQRRYWPMLVSTALHAGDIISPSHGFKAQSAAPHFTSQIFNRPSSILLAPGAQHRPG
jgi:hypothetical protein